MNPTDQERITALEVEVRILRASVERQNDLLSKRLDRQNELLGKLNDTITMAKGAKLALVGIVGLASTLSGLVVHLLGKG